MLPNRPLKRVSSRLAVLTLLALLLASGAASSGAAEESRQAATVTVDTGMTFQTITAWEATAWMGQDTSPNVANYTGDVMRVAVDELGLNRLRLEVRAGVENPEDYWTQYMNGTVDYTFWRSHRYTTVNDDADPDHINWSGFQFSELDHTVETVVLPFMQRVRTTGGEPLVNLNYVAFTSQNGAGTQYIHDDAAEYAELMLATFIHLDGTYSLVPDYVEVILEPDNVAQWNGYTIGAAIVATRAKLAAYGYNPQFIAPSNTNMGGAVSYFDQMAQVTGALGSLAELAYHRYGGVSDTNLRAIAQRGAANGIDTAMLEHIGSGHEDLHDDLTVANCSSWQQFTLAGLGTSDGGGSYLLVDETDPSDPVVTMASRTKYLRQYFAYVRPGAVRVGATTTEAAYAPVAFVGTDGMAVVVVKATAAGTITVRDLPEGLYGVRYTTATQYDVDLGNVRAGPRTPLVATIPAAGVITFHQIQRAPSIAVEPSDPEVELHEGMSADFRVTPLDAEPYELTFVWTVDGTVQTAWTSTSFQYSPDMDSQGEHTVNVRVSYTGEPSMASSFTWHVTVLNVNRWPVPEERWPDPFTTVYEEADGSLEFGLNASDPDGDVLTYTWYVDGTEVSSGYVATHTFEYDYGSAGVHTVAVEVSDSIDVVTVSWTVSVVNVNRPPVIISRDPGETVTVEETASGYLSLSVQTWDPDGDPLTYVWTLDDSIQYGYRYASYSFRYDHSSAGTYVVRVTVKDSWNETYASWLITVLDVNVPPSITRAYPSWSPYYYETEEGTLDFSVTASDPEGAELQYMWDIDGVVQEGETESTFTFVYGYDSAGVYSINATVSDGMDAASYTWRLTIYDTNRAPVVDAGYPIGNVSFNDRRTVTFQLLAQDLDGDDLYFLWYVNGSVVDDANMSSFLFDPLGATGNYTVQVWVHDGRGGYVSHYWNVTVFKKVVTPEEEFEMPWWGWVLLVFLLATGGIWLLAWGNRKRQTGPPPVYR